MIMSMSVPDDYTTMNALKAMLMLREIPVVGTATVEVSERQTESGGQAQKAGSTNNGTVQPSTTNQSVLRQAASMLTGG